MNDRSDQNRVRKQTRMFVQWKVDGRKRKKMKKQTGGKRDIEKPGKEEQGGGVSCEMAHHIFCSRVLRHPLLLDHF